MQLRRVVLPRAVTRAPHAFRFEPRDSPENPKRMHSRTPCGARRRKLTKQQQQKHAMTVHAAHVITTDYVALSQPLAEVRRSCLPVPLPMHTPRHAAATALRLSSTVGFPAARQHVQSPRAGPRVPQGILLMDRTDRKLKLIHSLGELLPNHSYTTEYGNVITR